MRLLVILDPLSQIKTYKDTTYAMMVEAATRGHALFVCGQHQLSYANERAMVVATPLQITDDTGSGGPWYALGAPAPGPVAAFDAVLMRKDPPFDMEYVYSTYLLEQAVREGARVFNDPRAIRDHNEKLSVAEFPQFAAPTLVTRSADALRAFVDEHDEAVFKLLDGMGGTSIFRAKRGDPNLSVIIEALNLFGARTVMAQRYIPQISEGDKRVLLIGGEVVPYSLARIPKTGEFRGNLAAGGTGVAKPLSARDREVGEALAPKLAARGLLLVGLDLIGDYVTEINVTSPTCFQEIRQQKGFDVARLFVDKLEAAVAQPPPLPR
ncbi:MAG: glutathione synthase [Burkholderiaceae bacterium]|nr:glutathione synthase [Burkholderiaceae bacterium]